MYNLLVGCYSGEGDGIYSYTLCKNGKFALQNSFDEHRNPTYLAKKGNIIYAACEQETGKIAALEFDGSKLRTINTLDIPGAGTCHVAAHPTKKLLFASNYVSGDEVLCRLNEDGSIGDIIDHVKYKGTSHCHCVAIAPDAFETISVNLGRDKIYLRGYNVVDRQRPDTGTPPSVSLKLPQGAGPRHFIFHSSGKFGYLVTEMANTVVAYSYEAGNLQKLQELPLLPPSYKDQSYAAAIKISPCGRWLYVSNRGYDGITLFAIDATTGQLTLKYLYPTGGHWPRDFCLTPLGEMIIVANQKSNNLVSFAVDTHTGAIGRQLDTTTVTNPACVVMAEVSSITIA